MLPCKQVVEQPRNEVPDLGTPPAAQTGHPRARKARGWAARLARVSCPLSSDSPTVALLVAVMES